MNIPGLYNPPDHYENDGLEAFSLTLKYNDVTPVDLTGAKAKAQLKDGNRLVYEFDSEHGTLSLVDGGVVVFNEIKSWNIPAGKYVYDLQITDATGFVRTYLKGTWTVVADITK